MLDGLFRIPAFELLRFAIVGGTATFVHACSGFIAVDAFGLNGLFANAIGFGCAWWVSFFGHHLFTFQSRANPRIALLRFIFHSFAMFAIAFFITALAVNFLGFITERFIPVVGATVVPLISYLSSKFFVFRQAVS